MQKNKNKKINLDHAEFDELARRCNHHLALFSYQNRFQTSNKENVITVSSFQISHSLAQSISSNTNKFTCYYCCYNSHGFGCSIHGYYSFLCCCSNCHGFHGCCNYCNSLDKKRSCKSYVQQVEPIYWYKNIGFRDGGGAKQAGFDVKLNS